MTAAVVRPIDLDTLVLHSGGHNPPPDDSLGEACLLEVAAWMAGEPWTDSPQCVCPVLAAFGRRLNDVLPHDRRQELKRFLPAMLGTAGDGLMDVRRFMAADWAVRTAAPLWLDAADQPARAATLRALPAIVDWETLRSARPVMRRMADELWAVRRAKLAELRAKAPVAVAAGVAAGVAVAVAAGAADAAAVAAGAAAGAAVADAAGAAAGPTWTQVYDAAYAAAKARIEERYAPVTAEVQTQAITLFGRMVRPEAA